MIDLSRLDATKVKLIAFWGRGPLRRVIAELVVNLVRHDALYLASAMAFDLFLALIPLLALAGWFVSLVLQDNLDTLQNLSLWLNLAPDDVRHVINQHAENFSGKALAPIALAGALWLGSGAFSTVMAAFEETVPSDPRPWWVRRAIAVACVPCFLGSLGLGAWLALHATHWPELIAELAPQAPSLEQTGFGYTRAVGIVVSSATIILLVAGFFRIGVRRDVRRRRVWPGTLLTLCIGSAASYGFAAYAGRIAQYAVYYGSLAAVAVLMAWLWICSLALLVGAELNVALENATSDDDDT